MQPELLPLPAPPAVPVVRCRNPLCHRVLTDPQSRVVGMGRCCAEAFGLTPARPGRLRWTPQTGDALFEINEGDDMAKTIEIQGVWLIKQPDHLGNGLQVLVQLADGTYHQAITEVADDGPISHYVHPGGILAGPVVTFDLGSGLQVLVQAEPS